MIGVYIGVAIVAYFLGSISFSVIFSRKFAGFDVREKGSKNAGSTNVLRTVGKKAAALTLVCDVLKGVMAIVVAILAGRIWTEVDETLLENMPGNKLVTHGQVRRRYNPDDFITGNILASLGLKLRNGKQPTSGSDFVTKKVIEETYHVKKSLLKDFKDNDFIPCRYVQAPGKDVE